MRKGTLIGAIMGFLAGLVIQSTGSWMTGMAARSLNADLILAASVALTVFVASLCGVIGAFLGALLQQVLERK